MIPPPPSSPLFPYTTLFRSERSLARTPGEPAVWARSAHVSADGRLAVLLYDGLSLLRLPELADRKSTRLNSSHRCISYAVFCLKKKNKTRRPRLGLPFGSGV